MMRRALALLLVLSPALDAAPAARKILAPAQTTRVRSLALPRSAVAAPSAVAPKFPGAKAPAAPSRAPLQELRALAADPRTEEAAAGEFDGEEVKGRSRSSVLWIPEEPAPLGPEWRPRRGQDGPRGIPKPGLQEATPKSSQRFLSALGLGVMAAVSFPVIYSATPALSLIYTLPTALAATGAALVALYAAEKILRRFPLIAAPAGKPQGPPRRALTTLALGSALGLALGAAPTLFNGPIVEKGFAVAAPKQELRRVRGGALKEEIIRELSRNPVGHGILEQLRDRGGTIRLPEFFVSAQKDQWMAANLPTLDAVFIAKNEITSRGWTVDEFVKNPELQGRFAKEFRTTFAHELTHAVQVRRSLILPGAAMESEYEAFLAQHFYVHALLMVDPHAELSKYDLGEYLTALPDLEKYLHSLDTHESYKNEEHVRTPDYDKYFAQVRAQWPEHAKEGYVLLARRALPDHPRLAAAYWAKASELARKHGLPPPDPNAPPQLRLTR